LKYAESLEMLVRMGPILFGVGFLAPLIAQSVDALGWQAPFGLPSIAFGLVVGTMLGLLARYRGSWV
jgi:hypothetical protein